jgi:hypothetical protein
MTEQTSGLFIQVVPQRRIPIRLLINMFLLVLTVASILYAEYVNEWKYYLTPAVLMLTMLLINFVQFQKQEKIRSAIIAMVLTILTGTIYLNPGITYLHFLYGFVIIFLVFNCERDLVIFTAGFILMHHFWIVSGASKDAFFPVASWATNDILFYFLLMLGLSALSSFLAHSLKIQENLNRDLGIQLESSNWLDMAAPDFLLGDVKKPNMSENQELLKDEWNFKASDPDVGEKVRTWISEGIFLIQDFLKTHQVIDEQFYSNLLHRVITYLRASNGILYLAQNYDNRTMLEVKARNNHGKPNYPDQPLPADQGLVGQAFIQKKIFQLEDIPDNYIMVRSAANDANPHTLIFIPLLSGDECIGVIELATSHKFSEKMHLLLQHYSQMLGTAVFSAIFRNKTNEILSFSREISMRMKFQNQEMIENIEGLELTLRQTREESTRK